MKLILLFCLGTCLAFSTMGQTKKVHFSKAGVFQLNYQGFRGHTIGLTYGLKKECHYCNQRFRKYLGAGFELGFDYYGNKIIGPKIVFEKGNKGAGLKLITMVFFTEFTQISYLFRPELSFYPFKKYPVSIGLGYNFHNSFTTNELYDSFGIFCFNVSVFLKK